MSSSAPEKRCLYEVLDLPQTCTGDEIRSAYKRLALQRHPDKLIQSGISAAESTASFQELRNAYEVLSDPKERSWYDSHRTQILLSSSTPSGPSSIPNLFNFFSNSSFSGFSDTGKGFFRVYADVFDRIYNNELIVAKKLGLGLGEVQEAPVFGNLKSPYSQVTAFYAYWLGFGTVMDFCWVDVFDAEAGLDRRSRRAMDEENKKVRKRAKREYNDTVRGLSEFVKKRDKRVIDMKVRKGLEEEKRKEEARVKKREAERAKLERARAFEVPEWAKGEDIDDGVGFDEEEEGKKEEFYCVICGKKFKSDKQWKNHEQSKKHKEKVAEFRGSFKDEEEEVEVDKSEKDGDDRFVDVEDNGVDRLTEKFQDGLSVEESDVDGGVEFVDVVDGGVEEEKSEEKIPSSEEEDEEEEVGGFGFGGVKGASAVLGSDDDTGILEAMLTGRRNRKKVGLTPSAKEQVGVDSEEVDSMKYDNRKGTRKNRRRDKSKKAAAEDAMRAETSEANVGNEESYENGSADVQDSGSHMESEANGLGNGNADVQGSGSHSKNEANGFGDHMKKTQKIAKQAKVPSLPVDSNASTKRETNARSKNSSKGRKQKGRQKDSEHVCDACGQDFESRNKLHRHLEDTGHATLKSR